MIAPRAFPRCAQSPVAIIPLSMIDRPQKPPLCKGRWQKSLIFDGGIVPLQRFDFAGCKAQGQDTAAGRLILHYGMIATGNHDHLRFAARSTTPLLSLTYVPARLAGADSIRPGGVALTASPRLGRNGKRLPLGGGSKPPPYVYWPTFCLGS